MINYPGTSYLLLKWRFKALFLLRIIIYIFSSYPQYRYISLIIKVIKILRQNIRMNFKIYLEIIEDDEKKNFV